MPKQTPPNPRRKADSADIAFARLRQAILDGELKDGERVREKRLAEKWNVGVTPMREAVRRMAAIGYLVLKPNHAPIVRKLDNQDIRQIYKLRETLECLALQEVVESLPGKQLNKVRKRIDQIDAMKATERRIQAQLDLDTLLHDLWCEQSDNPWLSSTLERLLIYRPNILELLKGHPQLIEQAYQEHKRIVEALEAGNAKKAVSLLGQHIHSSGISLSSISP